MKTKLALKLGAALLLLSTIYPQLSTCLAQGTAFTYQGRLNNGTNPATGSYDLTFALFSVSSGLGQVGSPLTNAATAVSNGLFNVTLDFGNQFLGAARWMEIGVRTNGNGTFTTLAPRQALTPTPYAVYAESANVSNLVGTIPALNLSGTALLGGGNTFNGAQNINDSADNNALNLSDTRTSMPGSGAQISLIDNYSGSPESSIIGSIGDGGGFTWRNGALELRPVSRVNIYKGFAVNSASQVALTMIGSSGNVGIGTISPQAPLDVVGSNPYPHLRVAASSNAPYGAFLSMDATATTNGKDYLIFSTGNAAGEGQGKLVFQNHSDGVQILTLTSNGNVGIGTLSPQSKLEVTGSASGLSDYAGVIHGIQASGSFFGAGVLGESLVPGGNGVIGRADVPGTGGNFPAGVWGVTAATNGVAVYAEASATSGVNFGVKASTASTKGYAGYFDGRVYFSGNVGIGTNAPQQALHVIGNILASGTITGSSDRNVKEHFSAVDARAVLEKVSVLPISEWNYKADSETLRHIGPMAQDFYAAFAVGMDDKHISMVDADGVALAAIQGLNEKVESGKQKAESRIQTLEAENAELKRRLDALEQTILNQNQIERSKP